MTSHTLLLQYIDKYLSLTQEEATQFCACFKEIKIRKRQLVVQPNFVSKHRYYITKGVFRSYVVDEQGQDHTIQFAIEDWWITDYNSYLFQQPATMFVEALENSIVLEINFENEKKLKKQNHKFETFFRIISERCVAFEQRKSIAYITKSATERYEDFIDKYHEISQRVPQYTLASFLGMSNEFLSRIRNKRLKKS